MMEQSPLESAADGLDVGFIVCNRNFELLFWNRKATELLELPVGILVRGRNMREVLRYFAERGDYGRGDPLSLAGHLLNDISHATLTQPFSYFRVVPGGRAIQMRIQRTRQGSIVFQQSELLGEESLLEDHGDALIFADHDQTILSFNRGAERIFGWQAVEVEGKPFAILLPEQYRKAHYDHVKSFEQSIERFRLMHGRDVMGLRKSGEEFPAETSIAKVRSGGALVFAVSLRDITDRKQAEAAQRQSKLALEQASKLAKLGHYRWSGTRQRLLSCSDQYRQILGLPAEKAPQNSTGLERFLHPDDRERVLREYRAAEAEGRGVQIEFRVIRRDGQIRYVRDISEPEPNPDGSVETWFGTVQDITELVQNRQALLTSERRFQDLVEGSIQGMLVHDENGKPLFANKVLAQIYGFDSPEELLKLDSLDQFIPPQERDRVMSYRRARLRGEPAPEAYETERLKRDGTPIWVENRSRRIEWNGKLAILAIHVDITERKRAMEALRLSEKRSRELAEITSDWHWETDDEFRVARYSEKYDAGVIGGRDNIIGRTLWQIAGVENPEKDELWAKFYKLVRAHQPVRDFEYRLTNMDGRILRRRSSGRPVFDALGRFKGYLFATRDVTAEVKARKRAREAEELLSRAIESISDGIAIYDASDRLTLMNSRYKSLFLGNVPSDATGEATESGAVGQTFEGLIRYETMNGYYPDAVGREEDFIQQRLAAHRQSGKPLVYRIRTGQWVQARDHQMPDGSIVAVRSDVTSLVEAEERYRSLADNLPGVVYRRIVRPNGEMRETYVSAAVKQMLGVDPQEFTSGRARLIDYQHPEDREKKLALLRKSMERLEPLIVERERFIGPGGGIRWWQLYAMPRRLPDGSTQFDGIALDVTDQKATEDQLRRAQKLEALGQLTGGISHDFNNLLGVIIGNLDFALEQAAGNRKLEELIGAAITSAIRGADLTKRLLAFSRGQSFSDESVDLNRMLPRIEAMLRPTLGEQIAIEMRFGKDLWPCFVDPSQIDDIILNLAINARDAMPAGGTLTIETDNVHLDKAYSERVGDIRPGDFVMLSVSDTGKGIPKKVLEHVFEPFFTTKEPGKGTGLGLSQVYGFVKRSKGHISIYSEVGLGTTVKIYLPCAEAKPMARTKDQADGQAPRGSGTILIVEDDEKLRVIAVQELRDLGYRTLEADSGAAALVVLNAHPEINALFSDVVMPGATTGYDLAREVRSRHPQVKILMTSGYTGNAPRRSGTDTEGIGFLTKPYRKWDLAVRLKQLLEE